jgi:hypothetical protein
VFFVIETTGVTSLFSPHINIRREREIEWSRGREENTSGNFIAFWWVPMMMMMDFTVV